MEDGIGRKLTQEELQELNYKFGPVFRRIARQVELEKLEDLLIAEVHHWHTALKNGDSQYVRRAFVRSLLAYIEGSALALREFLVLDDEEERNAHLNAEEVEILRENVRTSKLELNKHGEIQKRRKTDHARTVPLLLFTLRTYAKSHGVEADLRKGIHLWESFQKTLELRNELMHPKSPASIEVSDANLQAARYGYNWYFVVLTSIHLDAHRIAWSTFVNHRVGEEPEKLKSALMSHIDRLAKALDFGILK